MKNLKRTIFAIVAVMALALPASAQFRFGLKGGVDVNTVAFDDIKGTFDAENRTGFTAGISTEFKVPVIGIGFDLSVMYVHRVNEGTTTDQALNDLLHNPDFAKEDFVQVPLNLKWRIGIPVVEKIVAPFITTGPSIAFKCSKEAATSVYKEKRFNAAWNVGGGAELLGHIQIGVNYGWGMTKTLEYIGLENEPVDLGKTKGWTITAAYYF